MNFSEIYEGWRNHLIPPKELKVLIEKVSEQRLNICTPCEKNSTPSKIKFYSRCTECGCPLKQKSKSLQSSCPLGKWSSVATQEQEREINLAIKNDSQ